MLAPCLLLINNECTDATISFDWQCKQMRLFENGTEIVNRCVRLLLSRRLACKHHLSQTFNVTNQKRNCIVERDIDKRTEMWIHIIEIMFLLIFTDFDSFRFVLVRYNCLAPIDLWFEFLLVVELYSIVGLSSSDIGICKRSIQAESTSVQYLL